MTPQKSATTRALKPTAFATIADFRAWLETHHKTVTELSLRCFKNHASDRGIGYFDALDEALAFGWIDGVRKRLDEDSYTVRFTPRRPRSKWSAINVKRATQLEAEGRMKPAGLAAFQARGKNHPIEYSYESRPRELDPAFVRIFKRTPRAWRFFETQAPWYRRTCAFWVMSAKRLETRLRRLHVLMASSAKGQPVPPLMRPRKRRTTPRRG